MSNNEAIAGKQTNSEMHYLPLKTFLGTGVFIRKIKQMLN